MLLKELTSLFAPSGFEDEVREFVKKHACADEVYTDRIGNLICRKRRDLKERRTNNHALEVVEIVVSYTIRII